MFSIEKCPVPVNSMLAKYSMNRAFVDCYTTEVSGTIDLPGFVFAFYTSPLLKLERFILKLSLSKPSTDADVRRLAQGDTQIFAMWNVEGRSNNEILLRDFRGRTRSWLMVAPVNEDQTRLFFGSAVVPGENSQTGAPSLGFVFHALLGFHQIYSLMLLYLAKSRIVTERSRRANQRPADLARSASDTNHGGDRE